MTVDPSSAVAALLAAKDIEALEAAIGSASFLDNTPGDDRQKLRGECGHSCPAGALVGASSVATSGSGPPQPAPLACYPCVTLPADPRMQRPARG